MQTHNTTMLRKRLFGWLKLFLFVKSRHPFFNATDFKSKLKPAYMKNAPGVLQWELWHTKFWQARYLGYLRVVKRAHKICSHRLKAKLDFFYQRARNLPTTHEWLICERVLVFFFSLTIGSSPWSMHYDYQCCDRSTVNAFKVSGRTKTLQYKIKCVHQVK